MKLSSLALWAVITTLTAAAPTTTSNPNDPSNLTNDSTVEKRTTCNVISGDSNRILYAFDR
ncbi:hypothetical protein N0V85_006109 [Neurospora sp. IMI 360204]|nr:hypothetical protein N0V85_006109 [Neurospora sp. IMI 360204]